MLDHAQQRPRRQIEPLPALTALQPLIAGQIAAAAIGALGRMLDSFVRGRDRLKPRALTKLRANASRHKAMSYERMVAKEAQLEA